MASQFLVVKFENLAQPKNILRNWIFFQRERPQFGDFLESLWGFPGKAVAFLMDYVKIGLIFYEIY